MSYGKMCDEPGCKEYAEYSISVALRYSPNKIATELSKKLNYVCGKHQHQTFDEFISQEIWDKLIESKISQKLPMPIRSISYLVILPLKPTLKFI